MKKAEDCKYLAIYKNGNDDISTPNYIIRNTNTNLEPSFYSDDKIGYSLCDLIDVLEGGLLIKFSNDEHKLMSFDAIPICIKCDVVEKEIIFTYPEECSKNIIEPLDALTIKAKNPRTIISGNFNLVIYQDVVRG